MQYGAILTCSDKAGVPAFARALEAAGLRILASAGTHAALRGEGVASESLEAYTSQPPGSHAKTLQAKLHEGLFADPEAPGERDLLARLGAWPIRVVCCTLYPLVREVARGRVPDRRALHGLLDVGGPALLANAAKNFERVWCVTAPEDFAPVAEGLRAPAAETLELRRRLAVKAYGLLADYYRTAGAELERIPCP